MILPLRTRALLILGLGVVVSACSPPNEQPSDRKVATATGVVATPAALPRVIECVGAPEFKPESLALACADANDRLVSIRWTDWTATSATGTGVRETNNCEPNCAKGTIERTRDVEVELSEPVRSPQGLVFSRLVVEDEEILL